MINIMYAKNYFLKMIILFAATFAGLFAVWYALIRQESVDWLVGQVAHQVSPYAISEIDAGLIITNVVAGYEFKLPQGFKTLGARNLSFYLEDGGGKKCEIRHKSAGGNLFFELVNEKETNICRRYLEQIRGSLRF